MKVLYKTVTPILAVLIFPAMLFMPFFRLITASDTVNKMLAEYGLGEQITLFDLFHAVSNIKDKAAADGKTLNFSMSVLPEEARGYLTAFIAFAAAAVVCALLIIILSLATKKKIPVFSAAVLGIFSTVMMNFFFDKAAHGFITGEINVIDIYTAVTGDESVSTLTGLVGNILGAVNSESGALGSILNSFLGDYSGVDIRILELSSAYIFMLLIFIAAAVFTLVMKLAENTSDK